MFPFFAHGADPIAVFGVFGFLAAVITALTLSASKKPQDKNTGCIMWVLISLFVLGFCIYGYWQTNHPSH